MVSIHPATCTRDYSTTGDWLKFESVRWQSFSNYRHFSRCYTAAYGRDIPRCMLLELQKYLVTLPDGGRDGVRSDGFDQHLYLAHTCLICHEMLGISKSYGLSRTVPGKTHAAQ